MRINEVDKDEDLVRKNCSDILGSDIRFGFFQEGGFLLGEAPLYASFLGLFSRSWSRLLSVAAVDLASVGLR